MTFNISSVCLLFFSKWLHKISFLFPFKTFSSMICQKVENFSINLFYLFEVMFSFLKLIWGILIFQFEKAKTYQKQLFCLFKSKKSFLLCSKFFNKIEIYSKPFSWTDFQWFSIVYLCFFFLFFFSINLQLFELFTSITS